MFEKLTLRIAGLVFALCSEFPEDTFQLDGIYKGFVCEGEPDIVIVAHNGGVPQISLQEKDKAFDSETLWSLYQPDGRNVFVLSSPAFGPNPYRIAIFDKDFRHGEVYSVPPEDREGPLPNPLDFPLSEVLMVCLLARSRGLMAHACGIDDHGRGCLFAGNSTHGKTTMARLWKDRAEVLNDDRIVLRYREGRFWMYGTPWHGEYTGVSSRGVPLEKVFFLRHAEANNSRPVEGAAAVSMLLARCFPPLWDTEGMRFTLDFCGQLVASASCHELDFLPNESIMDFVRCVV